MAAATPLSHDAVRSVLVQLDGLLVKGRFERELREAEASGDPHEANQRGLEAAIAGDMCEWDRAPDGGGWGSAGPPAVSESAVARGDAVRRGIVVPRPRRTTRSRRAAHRPSARRTATRAGPGGDEDGDPEPGGAGHPDDLGEAAP